MGPALCPDGDGEVENEFEFEPPLMGDVPTVNGLRSIHTSSPDSAATDANGLTSNTVKMSFLAGVIGICVGSAFALACRSKTLGGANKEDDVYFDISMDGDLARTV